MQYVDLAHVAMTILAGILGLFYAVGRRRRNGLAEQLLEEREGLARQAKDLRELEADYVALQRENRAMASARDQAEQTCGEHKEQVRLLGLEIKGALTREGEQRARADALASEVASLKADLGRLAREGDIGCNREMAIRHILWYVQEIRSALDDVQDTASRVNVLFASAPPEEAAEPAPSHIHTFDNVPTSLSHQPSAADIAKAQPLFGGAPVAWETSDGIFNSRKSAVLQNAARVP